MTDHADVRRVAADYVQRQGPGAVDSLLEKAEIADGQGDAEAADTWREIAEAAVAIIETGLWHGRGGRR